MTREIQEILRGVLVSCTDIPENRVYFTPAEESQFQAAPWASIIPGEKRLSPVWQWDSRQEGERVMRVRRRYNAEEPFQVKLRRSKPEDMIGDMEAFIKTLPRRVLAEQAEVRLAAFRAEPLPGGGVMDESGGVIGIIARYGIYTNEGPGCIKKVTLKIKDKE